MENLAQVLDFLGLFVSAGLAFIFSVWMLNIQKKKNAEKTQAEQEKINAERKRIEAEVWQMVNDELRDEIARWRTEAHELRQEREQWLKKEAFLEATIDELKAQIKELNRKLREVKKDTDQLKSETGPIPAQKRKPPKDE